MSVNRIFKREAQRQVKEGIRKKRRGKKNIILPFIVQPDPRKHVHPRGNR